MRIGQVEITFQRTIRVPDKKTPAHLPPGLGQFPVYKVGEYRGNCPELWEDGGVFIPMHDEEAMWMNFHLVGNNPRALVIGAGSVNAVTGEPLKVGLEEPQNYVVLPTQPWLDGWKDTDGVIYQFVATEFLGGEGLTVGEQILGEESKTGGIGIAVFVPKDENLVAHKPFGEHPITGPYDATPWGYSQMSVSYSGTVAMASAPTLRSADTSFKEMGLGRGGKIHQKIYPDPYVKDKEIEEVWNSDAESHTAVYLVDAETFEQITGEKVPPMPESFGQYGGAWFKLPDEEMPDTSGSGVFAGLQSVFVDEEGGDEEQE